MSDFTVSASSIKTYKQCKYQFFLKYIAKEKGYKDPDDQKAALFGNVIHKVLEKYHANDKLDPIALFKKEFSSHGMDDNKYFEQGINEIEAYVRDTTSGRKILGIEVPFNVYLQNGIPAKGFIDRIDRISEDEIEIIDYKTGRHSLSESDLKYDIQVGLYDLVARILFPGAKRVKLTLDYLHFGKVSIYKTDKERQSLEDYLAIVYEKIEQSVKANNPSIMQPRMTTLCSFCDYKSVCPEFKSLVSATETTAKETEEFTGMIDKASGVVIDAERIDEFLEIIKAKVRVLKKIEENAKNFIGEYIKQSGQDSVKFGRKTYSFSKKKYTIYDVNTVIEVCKDKVDLNTVLEPRKAEIDRKITSKKDVDLLQKNSIVKYSDSYVK